VDLRLQRFTYAFVAALALAVIAPAPVQAADVGVGNIPQGTQPDAWYAASSSAVSNVFATTQRVSCYTPEVPFAVSDGPNDGYSGETACPMTGTGAFSTGEALGPYPTQSGSNPGYPATTPMLVKDHSESDIRVDPTNAMHLIGSSKWFVSAEGYNHLLGFYESTDGGVTWPVQGHIPGYEGWTDNTDPVGAFDSHGDYYELILPYQFFYNNDGTHNFAINPNKEPNPTQPAEAISIAVRPHGAGTAKDWITTHNGQLDFVAPYPAKGQEPDKQWIAIDTNAGSPFKDTIYAMWAVFDGFNSKVFVSIAKAMGNGQHSDWSTPLQLPTVNGTAGDSYLLPHVAPNGTVYTSVTNFPGKGNFCCVTISVDWSTDGGQTWQGPSALAAQAIPETVAYTNTTFRQGISNSFAVGTKPGKNGKFPLYVAYEDYSAGSANSLLTASYDGGQIWSKPIQVNDNEISTVDEFQPNLAVADNGTVSVAFYDRRLPCPTQGSAEAGPAGLALDKVNPAYSGSLPPYGAANYCVNASIQFYHPDLTPIGHNTRLTQHSFDPQLNSPHTSCATCVRTFIGDYFGNTFSGTTSVSSFVSTYDDGTNHGNRQQQVVAQVSIP
jgi:hypothetical protein